MQSKMDLEKEHQITLGKKTAMELKISHTEENSHRDLVEHNRVKSPETLETSRLSSLFQHSAFLKPRNLKTPGENTKRAKLPTQIAATTTSNNTYSTFLSKRKESLLSSRGPKMSVKTTLSKEKRSVCQKVIDQDYHDYISNKQSLLPGLNYFQK